MTRAGGASGRAGRSAAKPRATNSARRPSPRKGSPTPSPPPDAAHPNKGVPAHRCPRIDSARWRAARGVLIHCCSSDNKSTHPTPIRRRSRRKCRNCPADYGAAAQAQRGTYAARRGHRCCHRAAEAALFAAAPPGTPPRRPGPRRCHRTARAAPPGTALLPPHRPGRAAWGRVPSGRAAGGRLAGPSRVDLGPHCLKINRQHIWRGRGFRPHEVNPIFGEGANCPRTPS